MRTISKGMLEVVLWVVNGAVAAGDRTLHAATAIVSNEFFLMIVTIAAFVLLMKS